jgi:hypothetical protein
VADREILNPDLNTMDVIAELAFEAVTDGRGLTLGDVGGHRRDRYFTLWRALHLVAGLARRGLLSAKDNLQPTAAEVQDNRAPGVFQAAHVLPCDFTFNGSPGLFSMFQSPIIKGNVKAHLFGRTNAVHGLVNSVDSRCEQQGWKAAFKLAIERIVEGAPPARVFQTSLVPDYDAAIARALARFERDVSALERQFINTPALLAPNGLPARLRGQDFRISKKLQDPRGRAANKAVVLQVFADYRLGPAGLVHSELKQAAQEADGWAELERDWRARHG